MTATGTVQASPLVRWRKVLVDNTIGTVVTEVRLEHLTRLPC